jgi:arylsulfatase
MHHRFRLITALVLVAASAVPVAKGERTTSTSQKRPNIIVIMADDMGYSDLGCYGSEIRTPNLDRLAREGLRFTRFYNAARCCPTRASLLTGLYPHQAGIGHMVSSHGPKFPGYQGYLNDRCVTIAEALRQGGYQTLMAGKWHVGEERPHWPVDRGFDHSFSLISGASNYFRLDNNRSMAIDDQAYQPPREGFYMTDAFSKNAVALIAQAAKKSEPFFLYLPFTSPHWPLHALPEDIARYRGKYREGWDALRKARHARMIEMGIVDPKWDLSPKDPKAPEWDRLPEARRDDLDLRMAVYAAQIDRMDQGIGHVLAKLDELKISDSTLILFLADNGGCAEEIDRGVQGAPAGEADSFLSYGLPWANASNTPFRRYKHWTHEGGISTPLIARWPSVIQKKGELTAQVGHLIDILPTCLDAAGVPYPESFNGHEIRPTEGKSLRPIFEGRIRDPHPAIFWEHEGNRAVRQGSWKLVARYKEPWELYNMEEDRTELHNLAEANPDKVAELSALYDAWAARADVRPWEEVQRADAERKAAQKGKAQPKAKPKRNAGNRSS